MWIPSLNIMFSRVIPVVANISTAFLFMEEKYLVIQIYPHFAHPFNSCRAFRLFPLLAIINNVCMHSSYKFLCGHMFSVFLSIYLGVELLVLW